MEWFFLALFFVFGASVGSFLNVVVLRFGFHEQGGERSACASCNATLAASDLVPIVSYLALRARCKHCGSAISIQYPLVEALTGVVFLLTFVTLPFTTLTEQVTLALYLGFWSSLVVLVVYDIRHTLIPYPFLYALSAFAVLKVILETVQAGSSAPLLDAFLGALVCGGFFALIYALTRGRGMGLGDAFVAGAVGLMLGLSQGIAAAAFGVWSGAIIGVLLILIAKNRVTLRSEIPFAPFLALGAFTAFLFHVSAFTPVFWSFL